MDRRDARFPEMAFNAITMTLVLSITDEEGDSADMLRDVEFPARFAVCPTCEGKGSHVNPNVDRKGISQEDFDADPDFKEAYLSGAYDVTCHECAGKRVVPEVNTDALSDEQKTALAAWEQEQADLADMDREDAATYRMECGGYDG